MKVKVAVAGTIGKVVVIDTNPGAQIGSSLRLPDGSVATVESLRALLADTTTGGATAHSTLTGLQIGNDHPQYLLAGDISKYVRTPVVMLPSDGEDGDRGPPGPKGDTGPVAPPIVWMGQDGEDGEPGGHWPLDLGINPVWARQHIFTQKYPAGSVNEGSILLKSIFPMLEFWDTNAAANTQRWQIFGENQKFQVRPISDDGTGGLNNAIEISAIGTAAVNALVFGNTTDNPTYQFLGTGTVIHEGPLRLKNYTVAGLPAGVQGDAAFVTDALAPVFGAAVAGAGAVKVPVYYTGAAWFVG